MDKFNLTNEQKGEILIYIKGMIAALQEMAEEKAKDKTPPPNPRFRMDDYLDN